MYFFKHWKLLKLTLYKIRKTEGRDEKCSLQSTKKAAVVSIGVNNTFKVIFTPLEYVPRMAKRLHFFGSRFLLFILRHQYLFGVLCRNKLSPQ